MDCVTKIRYGVQRMEGGYNVSIQKMRQACKLSHSARLLDSLTRKGLRRLQMFNSCKGSDVGKDKLFRGAVTRKCLFVAAYEI